MSLLDVESLECVRGDRPLFRGLSFTLKAGELLHVTGANGCGKTTLLRTVCGLTRAESGTIRWRGQTTAKLGDEFYADLAYVGHANGIQGDLTLSENLQTSAALGGTDHAAILGSLERLGLADFRNVPAKILSQGQKRRLALARLLIQFKPLWILDEPLSGLDVDSVSQMTHLFAEHLAAGGLIMITSHQDIPIQTKNVLPIRNT